MTVLSVAYPLAPVGPDAVGGAEQVLSHLDAALVARGHRSVVVAAEGSTVAGELVATPVPAGEITDDVRRRAEAEHYENIVATLNRRDVDVVHLHGIDFAAYLPPAGVPVLATLHLPPGWYPESIWSIDRPETYMHCVSESQRRACPPAATLLPTIENGVPVDRLAARVTKRRFAIALGRICPEKNFHVALDAGTRAGVPVLLGGQVFPYAEHKWYFAAHIAARITKPRRSPATRFPDGWKTGAKGHRYLGPLPFRRKRRLLAAARCLLSASLAPETSSLVAMEALAAGTPVVAFPSGALTDLIDPGVTGFLVHTEAEMADAIGAAGGLDPAACRAAAVERFSLGRMVGAYLARYAELAGVAC